MKHHQVRLKFGHRFVDTKQISAAREALLNWWSTSGRRLPWRHRKASTYKRIVSEVLLQRTKAETVARFWRVFLNRYPGWRALSDSSIEQIERTLRPIGLSRQRAPRLHALATALVRSRGRFPGNRAAVEELPGVGQYIANAIMLFCHGQAHPLVDVNMARVIERVFGARRLADIRYDSYLQTLSMALVRDEGAEAVNWAILDLGALVCKPRNPDCSRCPLVSICRYSAAAAKAARSRNHLRSGSGIHNPNAVQKR